MKHWIVVISFALGIWVSSQLDVSGPWMLAALAVVPPLLALQYWRVVNPWLALVVSLTIIGAAWSGVRGAWKDTEGEEGRSSVLVRMTAQASDFAQRKLGESGLKEDDVSLLNAMLLGNRDGLAPAQKQKFRDAGAQHLLALSGLHLGILIGLFSILILRRVQYSRWRWPVLVGVLLLLWLYCLMAGMPQSLLRAMLMATFYYIGLYSFRDGVGSEILANTLLIMLVVDPAALFDVGTQLSFVAVGSLIGLYPALEGIFPFEVFSRNLQGRWLRKLWQLSMVSVTAWLGTMPLCALYFHQFQPWQPLVGILLVPLTAFLLYLAFFLLLTSLTGISFLMVPFVFVVDKGLKLENRLLDWAGGLPCSTLTGIEIHWGHVLLLYILLFLLRAGLGSPVRILKYYIFGAFLLLLLLFLV